MDSEHRQDADATWHWLPANDPNKSKRWSQSQSAWALLLGRAWPEAKTPAPSCHLYLFTAPYHCYLAEFIGRHPQPATCLRLSRDASCLQLVVFWEDSGFGVPGLHLRESLRFGFLVLRKVGGRFRPGEKCADARVRGVAPIKMRALGIRRADHFPVRW